MNEHARQIGLLALADLMYEYYCELVAKGMSESLAERVAGDWHQAALEAARYEIIARMTQKVARSRHAND